MIVADTDERSPLKGALADPVPSPVPREQRSPPPPYAYGAAHYPVPPTPNHQGGLPPPVSYSPRAGSAVGSPRTHWPNGGDHASATTTPPHSPHYYYHYHYTGAPPPRRNVTRATLKRFLGAYLAAILVLFFVGIFMGGIEVASTVHLRLRNTSRSQIKEWAEDTFSIQFGRRGMGGVTMQDCPCMPGSVAAPPSASPLEQRSGPGPLPVDRDNND